MPSTAERNLFRRLIGDFGGSNVSTNDIDTYLNDVTYELTADFVDVTGASAPVTSFDTLVIQYHIEVIYAAAIEYLWNKLGILADRHTQTVGQASQNASEKFDHVMRMLEMLTEQYQSIQQLGIEISIGDLSRFSKGTLTRIGGQSEEDALES